MSLYILRRFINYLILTMLATVIGYILASILLNPAARFYGRNPRPSDAAIEASLQKLGVDPKVPVLQRTWDWFSNILLHGTFGLENNLDPVGPRHAGALAGQPAAAPDRLTSRCRCSGWPSGCGAPCGSTSSATRS